MNLKTFEELINNPLLLDDDTLFEIEQLVRDYPYCQTLQLLYVKNLYTVKNIKYQQKLKIAASIVGDRSRLKRYIEGVPSDVSREVERIVQARMHKVTEPIPVIDALSEDNIDMQEEPPTVAVIDAPVQETNNPEITVPANEVKENEEPGKAEPVYVVRAKKVSPAKRYITSEYLSSLLDDDTTREFSHADLYPNEVAQNRKSDTVEPTSVIEKEIVPIVSEKEEENSIDLSEIGTETVPPVFSTIAVSQQTQQPESLKPRLRSRGKEKILTESDLVEKMGVVVNDLVEKPAETKKHGHSKEEKKRSIIEMINKRFEYKGNDEIKHKEPKEKKTRLSPHRSIKSALADIDINEIKNQSSDDSSILYNELESDYSTNINIDLQYNAARTQLKSNEEGAKLDIIVHDYFESEPPLSPLHQAPIEQTKGDEETKQSEETIRKHIVVNRDIGITKSTVKPELKAELKAEPTPADLIDKFLRDAPRISRPKREFYNPINLASLASSENEDFYTETYARICYQQGDPNKAIKIYNKLSLNFPEKSSYFAGLIEEIKKEQNI